MPGEGEVLTHLVDPTKVCETAFQNAASIASLLLTTEAIVSELPEGEEPAGGQHDHGRGGFQPGPGRGKTGSDTKGDFSPATCVALGLGLSRA